MANALRWILLHYRLGKAPQAGRQILTSQIKIPHAKKKILQNRENPAEKLKSKSERIF